MLLETCPPIPANLTEPCAVPDRDIATNGDLARAYIDATECVEESRIKLEAVRALGECRVKALAAAREAIPESERIKEKSPSKR